VGPGRILDGCGKRVEPEVKAGDVVLVSEYNAAQSNGLNYIEDGVALTPESDIVAVVGP
jgi:co-chaperonin GroES (HSP10)